MTHIINDNGINRPMTADEVAAWEQIQVDVQLAETEKAAQIAAKESAKESAKAKLAALGLTEEEVNAIIGGV